MSQKAGRFQPWVRSQVGPMQAYAAATRSGASSRRCHQRHAATLRLVLDQLRNRRLIFVRGRVSGNAQVRNDVAAGGCGSRGGGPCPVVGEEVEGPGRRWLCRKAA